VGDLFAFARMEAQPDLDSEAPARSLFVAVIVVRASGSPSDRAFALLANPNPVLALGSSSARSSIGRSQRRSRLVRRLRYRARPTPARGVAAIVSTRPDPDAASDRSGRPAPFVPTRRFASRVPASSSVSSSDEDSGDCVTTVGSLTDRVATRLEARPSSPSRLREDPHAPREDRAARSIEGHDRAGPGSRLIFPDDKNPRRAHRRVDAATREAASDALADEDVPRPEVARHSARRVVDAAAVPRCAPRARGPAARPVDVVGVPAPARRAIAEGDACIIASL
jgi:hypothetical protein